MILKNNGQTTDKIASNEKEKLSNDLTKPFESIILVPLTGFELPKRVFVLFCKFEKTPILRGFAAIYSNEVILSWHSFSQQ